MNPETGVSTLWGYFNQVVSAVYMADFACSLNCWHTLINSDSEAYRTADIFHGAIFFAGQEYIFQVTNFHRLIFL